MKIALIALFALVAAGPTLAAEETATVLASLVERGEIISEGDLETAKVAPAHARTALPADAIIGMEAKRRLQPGNTVRASDVKTPDMVKKGEAVSMLFQRGPLTIAATGRAMENGRSGQMIRVKNNDSGRVLDATIIGEAQVSVSAPGIGRL